MIKEKDSIIIESREEIEELQIIIMKYREAYPKEKDKDILDDLYNILDAMFYSW